MRPYRQQLVGLPLQRSLFRDIGRAAVPGLADILPGGRLGAWLDESGNLFLEPSGPELLSDVPPARLTGENLESMERAHRAACAAVCAATVLAGHSAWRLDEAAVCAQLGELGARIAALLPYGVLAKFVPDLLLRALAADGDSGPPPFPARSAGAELTAALCGLHRRCRELGGAPERLEAEWPAVKPEIAALIRNFCKHQAGFGPLAWDSPGYEEPRYVCRALRAAFRDVDPDGLLRRMEERPPPDGPDDKAGDRRQVVLRRVLAFWLDFLERETWYVRRAFYAGMAPLLRRLAAIRGGCRSEDLLFLDIRELTAERPPLADLPSRRQRYLTDEAYLSRRGVEPGRLTAMLEEP